MDLKRRPRAANSASSKPSRYSRGEGAVSIMSTAHWNSTPLSGTVSVRFVFGSNAAIVTPSGRRIQDTSCPGVRIFRKFFQCPGGAHAKPSSTASWASCAVRDVGT
jgi:hypothetical protein